MENLDYIYLYDSTSMSDDVAFMTDYVQKKIAECGHVVKVVDKPYPQNWIDEFGNSIWERRYYFENGWYAVTEPFRAKAKYKLAEIKELESPQ